MRKYRRANWTLADQAVISGSNFLCIYLLARSMEVVEFGLYMTGWTVLLFLVGLQAAVITQPHNVLGAKMDAAEYRGFTTVLALTQAAGSGILCLLLVGIGWLLHELVSPTYGRLVIAVAITAIPWMAQEFLRRAFYTRAQSRHAFINDAVSYALQLGGIAGVVLFAGSPTLELGFAVLGTSSAVAVAVGIWQLRDHISLWDVDAGRFRAHLGRSVNFGKWLFGSNLVSWVGDHGNTWLILVLLGPGPLGTYKAIAHLLNFLNPIRLAVYAYLPARGSAAYARGGVTELYKWILQALRMAGTPFLVLVLLLVVFSEPILGLAYGERFLGGDFHWILILGALAAGVDFARSLMEMSVLATEQSKPLFWRSILSVGFALSVGVALISQFGILGAPMTSLAKSVFLFTIMALLVRNVFSKLLVGQP